MQIVRLRPHEVRVIWDKKTRCLYFGLWFWAIKLDFGINYRKRQMLEAIHNARNEFKDYFNKSCLVCKKPLEVRNYGQVVKYHKQCRKFK